MTRTVDMAGAERLLLEADFEDLKLLWSSSNYVYLAKLCAGDGQEIAAVYKPESGETPLWDFPTGTLYAREAAAYELAQLLGWSFVPPTVVRDGPHGVGSLQLYVPHERSSHFFEQRDDPALVPQLQRMAVFDFVANNADRKGGHCLLDEQRRIWGIDHGLCFHREYKMRTVIWDWAEQPISDEWLGDVEQAALAVAGDEEQTEALRTLLSRDEVEALLAKPLQRLDRAFHQHDLEAGLAQETADELELGTLVVHHHHVEVASAGCARLARRRDSGFVLIRLFCHGALRRSGFESPPGFPFRGTPRPLTESTRGRGPTEGRCRTGCRGPPGWSRRWFRRAPR